MDAIKRPKRLLEAGMWAGKLPVNCTHSSNKFGGGGGGAIGASPFSQGEIAKMLVVYL